MMTTFSTIKTLLDNEESKIKEIQSRHYYSNQWFRSKFNEIASIDPESGKTGVALAIAISLSAISDIDRDE